MKYVYTGIVEKVDDVVEVYFPDLSNIRTAGDDYEDAILMAIDVLETYLSYLIESGKPVPRARYDYKVKDGQTVAFFTVSAPVEEATTMTVVEAANLLGVSSRRINAMVANGILAARKEGRDNMVTTASVDARMTAAPKAGRPRKTP